MLDALARLKTHMEDEAEKVQRDLEKRFDRILRSQLHQWSIRYPRHEFSAFYAHGILSLEVSPAICGQGCPDYLDKDGRGAIGQLAREANDFLDAFNGMSYRLEPIPLTAIIKLEKGAGTL